MLKGKTTVELPNRVAELREQRRESRNAFAKRCGLSTGAVRFIELGEVAPKIATRLAIANALGVSIDVAFPQEREAAFYAQRKRARDLTTTNQEAVAA